MGKKGYTTVELVVTLAIGAVLTALAVHNLSAPSPRRQLKEVAQTLIGQMRLARQRAISDGMKSQIIFDADLETYRFDPEIPGQAPPGEPIRLPPSIQFGLLNGVTKSPAESKKGKSDPDDKIDPDGISFNNNQATFQTNGTISNGTIYLKSDHETLALIVDITGRIRQSRWNGTVWEEI